MNERHKPCRHRGRPVFVSAVVRRKPSVNRIILMQLLDQPLSAYWKLAQDTCTLNEVDIEGGKVLVRRINDTSHLE